MTHIAILHTFTIGFVCGLRSMTAPALVSWAAHLGWIDLSGTPLAFMGFTATAYILTLLALGEMIADKLPKTPSRKALLGFSGRIILETLSGCALALGIGQSGLIGALLGAAGAVAGTLGGYEARTRLVRGLNVPDLVVALCEDVIAVALGFFVVYHNPRP